MTRTPSAFRRSRLMLGVAVIAIISLGVHLTRGSSASPSAPSEQAIPVTVHTLAPQSLRLWSEFSGRLKAVDAAEIRPEVGGKITQILFQDGQTVKAGDVLFVIDPRSYEAALAKAEANLATARTNANFARLELDRASGMMQSQAIAKRLYDERANGSRVASAAIKSAEAELSQARLNVEYAHVRAPISGRVGRAEITVGNLVQAGPNAPLLTSIVSDKGVYADFEVDEQTYLRSIRNSTHQRENERAIPVEMTLQGDAEHHYQGTIESFDNRLDATSGTIRARARFQNDDGALMPGMFASVRLGGAGEDTTLLIPDRALGFDQSKKFVYVVTPDNKVAYHEVILGKEVDGQRVALSGVSAGDRVIVDGLQHVKPDAVVSPTEEAAAPAAAAQDAQTLAKR